MWRTRLVRLLPAIVASMAAAQAPALDERVVAAFVRDLHGHLARDDRAAVAARVRYPLTVFARGVRVPLPDAAALIDRYDAVFSPALKELVAAAALPRERRESAGGSIVVGRRSATIAGALLVEPSDGTLKITGITMPLEQPAAEARSRSASATPRGARRQERLAPVGRPVQRSGALGRGEQHTYVLRAKKNQLLDVRITNVSRRDIVARIVHAKTGAPLDPQTRDGVRTWVGRIPEDGDYRIDVVRLAAGGEQWLPYLISVRLR